MTLRKLLSKYSNKGFSNDMEELQEAKQIK